MVNQVEFLGLAHTFATAPDRFSPGGACRLGMRLGLGMCSDLMQITPDPAQHCLQYHFVVLLCGGIDNILSRVEALEWG